jgi:hypothetical protein
MPAKKGETLLTPFSYNRLVITNELIIGDPDGPHLTLLPHLIGLYGAYRRGLFSLALREDTPELTLYDHNGRERLKLTIGGDGAPAIELLDANNHSRMTLSVGEHGEPYLFLYDAQQTMRAWVELTEAGLPELRVYDDQEEQIFEYAAGAKPVPE